MSVNDVDLSIRPECQDGTNKYMVNTLTSTIKTPSLELPGLIISAILISLCLILIIQSVIYRFVFIPDPRIHPRLKVRDLKRSLFASCMGLFLLACFGPLVDVLGSYNFNCYLIAIGFFFGMISTTGLVSRRMMIFIVKQRLSQTKAKIDLSKSTKQIREQRSFISKSGKWVLLFWFLIWPVIIVIIVSFLHYDLYFGHQCTNCEQLDQLDAKVILGLYSSYAGLCYICFILSYWENDVFAQIPEFRLQILMGIPLTYFGLAWIYTDPSGLNSSFKVRGIWFITFGGIMNHIIAISYQMRLALHEGQLINPNGTDVVSVLLQKLRTLWCCNRRSNRHEALVQTELVFDESTPLVTLLLEPEFLKAFEKYIVSEYCTELIFFHRRVLEFESRWPEMSEQERINLALQIYDQYIDAKGLFQVNIPYDMYKGLEKALKKVEGNRLPHIDITLFQPAHREVLNLLSDGPFQRFQKTQAFRNAIYGKRKDTANLVIMNPPRVSQLEKQGRNLGVTVSPSP